LMIDEGLWGRLSGWAEDLAREVLEMERIVLGRPGVWDELGIPGRARRKMAEFGRGEAREIRVMRFDFHFTTDGWRITEVNSDVPGGFVEAGGVSKFASSTVGGDLTADPAEMLAEAFRDELGEGALVVLALASGYTGDFQVMEFLARRFRAVGLRTMLSAPDQIEWRDGIPFAANGARVDGIYRFFPAEWLRNLARKSGWEIFFGGARVPLCNPATALISQNKRLPLYWEELQIVCPQWRALLPETRGVREVNLEGGDWVLKPALGRVGEAVGWKGGVSEKDWKKIRFWAKWFPKSWVAQRRFDSVALETEMGERHFCLGVYTVNGRAAGIYGRCSASPIIDYRAQDVAVLLPRERAVRTERQVPGELVMR
jgi:glutathionylspermidine synthase